MNLLYVNNCELKIICNGNLKTLKVDKEAIHPIKKIDIHENSTINECIIVIENNDFDYITSDRFECEKKTRATRAAKQDKEMPHKETRDWFLLAAAAVVFWGKKHAWQKGACSFWPI